MVCYTTVTPKCRLYKGTALLECFHTHIKYVSGHKSTVPTCSQSFNFFILVSVHQMNHGNQSANMSCTLSCPIAPECFKCKREEEEEKKYL